MKEMITIILGTLTILITLGLAVWSGFWYLSGEFREIHVELANIKGGNARVENKVDSFKVSHEREHDLFYTESKTKP